MPAQLSESWRTPQAEAADPCRGCISQVKFSLCCTMKVQHCKSHGVPKKNAGSGSSGCISVRSVAILAQDFCSRPSCSRGWTCSCLHCGVFCVSLLRRRLIPRRGLVSAPDGWVQIIRGPRPPSVKWPAASEGSGTTKKQGVVGVPGLRQEGVGVNHLHKPLPRSPSKPLNDVLLNSKVLSERLETPEGPR